jgi:hypothetical protein
LYVASTCRPDCERRDPRQSEKRRARR